MTPEETHIAYLESVISMQAYRIGELEAMMLYILNLSEHKHNKDTVYIKATACLQMNYSRSIDARNAYKLLLNG